MNDREDLYEWRERLYDLLADDAGAEVELTDFGGLVSFSEALTEVLAFRLAEETFAFDIKTISEILRPRLITSLPRSPSFVLGVLSLRGMILPVIDIKQRLGIGKFDLTRNHRVIVVADGDELMGFAVDSVVGVVRFAPGEIENTEYAESIDSSFLMGIGYDSKRQLVALLNTDKLCDFTLDVK